jgi:hypothetical protein
MAIVFDCNQQLTGKNGTKKPAVCKNYFHKKHRAHRKNWLKRIGKYQRKKGPLTPAGLNDSFNLPPNVTTRKRKRRTV